MGIESTYLIVWINSRVDLSSLVEQYDETHLLMVEVYRRMNTRRVRKWISNSQYVCASGLDAHPPVGLIRKECVPRVASRVVNTL